MCYDNFMTRLDESIITESFIRLTPVDSKSQLRELPPLNPLTLGFFRILWSSYNFIPERIKRDERVRKNYLRLTCF